MKSIYAVAFLVGISVMGVELSASRLIAPYFGTSLFVWTNVIGVILAALALGYYLGGRISERTPKLRVLLHILLVAGIMLAIIPFVVRPIAMAFSFGTIVFSSAAAVITLGSFLLTVALFFVPIMLLGVTSPFLIKLVSLERKDMGNVAGRIFAVSTVGSIIGTFLPALVFIPWIGTKFTILVFAAIIILVGVTGFGSKKLFLVIPLLGIPFGTLDGVLKPSPGLILEAESPYQYVQVIEDEGSRYLVYNEGGGVQSVYHPDSVFTGGLYFDIASLLPVLSDGYQVLILGVAGGTIPRAMQVLYGDEPDFHVDGVEIDPMVGEIATEYFSLEQPRLTMQYADGRQVVERTDKQYDVVFVDAFTNQLYIPFHLTTQEFFEATRDRLLPGGVLSMNVNALGEDSELFQAITNTVASVFPWVYQMPSGIGNHMIFASERPIPFERLKEVALPDLSFTDFAPLVAASISDIRFDSRARVLTDDLAPVEHLTDKMFWEFFVERLRAE